MKPKIRKPKARIGCVILKDVTFKYKGVAGLNEYRHKQPPVGEVVDCCKPGKDVKQLLPWDDRIVPGSLWLLPRTAKHVFPVGDGTELIQVHHSDLLILYEVDDGNKDTSSQVAGKALADE